MDHARAAALRTAGSSARQAPVVGAQQVAALGLGDRREVVLPRVRGRCAGAAVLVEPVELPAAQQEDAAQHELGHALRVRLGVGERERRAPRAAEHLPALDAEVLAQRLDVGDEVPGRVVVEARVRRALAAAALVEQHDAVARRIEEAAHLRVGPAARPAVQEHRRLAVRVAALLEVELVDVGDAQKARAVRFDRWIKSPACAPVRGGVAMRGNRTCKAR